MIYVSRALTHLREVAEAAFAFDRRALEFGVQLLQRALLIQPPLIANRLVEEAQLLGLFTAERKGVGGTGVCGWVAGRGRR
jgi:hypothetical protein